jgi:hypothetical protein
MAPGLSAATRVRSLPKTGLSAQTTKRATIIHRLQVLIATCFVIAVVYLCVRAVDPGIALDVPTWIRWFGQPGSHWSIALVLAFPVLHVALRWLSGTKFGTGTPLVLLATMAATALALGFFAYLPCHKDHAPAFAPFTWTLALFAGESETVFGADSPFTACANTPVAFDLARLLAISTTLGTALTAALTLFRSERDRFAIRRARSLVVVVGLADDTVSMVRSIARTISRGERLVVLARDANSNAARAVHNFGAKIRVVDLDEAGCLADLQLWKRLRQLYLLSEDPVQNLKRFKVIDSQLADEADGLARRPLIVRIDNPWQAEVWRRSFLPRTDRRWAGDAVGRYEVTAAKLVRHLTSQSHTAEPDTPATVVLCGLNPLTYAVASELAQLQREQALFERPRVVPATDAVIFACGAQGFVEDHQARQRTLAPAGSAFPVSARSAEPTVDAISDYVGDDRRGFAVVFGDPSMETEGIRLAARFPDLKVYVASAVSRELGDYSIIGQLYSFPINMELAEDAPPDVWVRAAELIHEHYSRDRDRTQRATKPWKELDPFFQRSNLRQVLNALEMVESLTDHTWNSFESGPAPSLPTGFEEMKPLKQLEILGFDEQTVGKMVKREHEDWYDFYIEEGWKYAKVRDDDHKRHNGLLPWDEFVQRDGSLEIARRSLASTLINLRNLGYRSVPSAANQSGVRLQDVS